MPPPRPAGHLRARGRKGDPLSAARRTLHTGAALLTEKQQARLEALFAVSEHVEVEATWGIYQRMIAAYREPDQKHGKAMMQAVIDSVASGVPATLTEIRKLGPTLKQRATDILAVFDRPGTSNGPTEAINGRLKHLVGSAGPTLTLRPCVGAGQLTWSGCCWVTGGRAPSVPRRDRWSAKSPAVSAPAPSHQPGTPGPGAGGLAQLHRVGSSVVGL